MSQVPPDSPPPPPPPPGAPVPPPPGPGDAGPPGGGWGPPSGGGWGPSSGEMPLEQPPAQSNKVMLIGLALVAVLVIGGGFFVLSSGGDEESGQGDTSSTTAATDEDGESPASEGEGDGEDSGGGDAAPSTEGQSYEQVVEAWLTAMAEGDCETIVSTGTERGRNGMDVEMAVDECEIAQQEVTPDMRQVYENLEIITPSQSGEVAEVICADPDAPGGLMITVTLVREDGAWLIDHME